MKNKRKYNKPFLKKHGSFSAKTLAIDPVEDCDGFGGNVTLSMGNTGSVVGGCRSV